MGDSLKFLFVWFPSSVREAGQADTVCTCSCSCSHWCGKGTSGSSKGCFYSLLNSALSRNHVVPWRTAWMLDNKVCLNGSESHSLHIGNRLVFFSFVFLAFKSFNNNAMSLQALLLLLFAIPVALSLSLVMTCQSLITSSWLIFSFSAYSVWTCYPSSRGFIPCVNFLWPLLWGAEHIP